MFLVNMVTPGADDDDGTLGVGLGNVSPMLESQGLGKLRLIVGVSPD